jgi:hypothetical protein
MPLLEEIPSAASLTVGLPLSPPPSPTKAVPQPLEIEGPVPIIDTKKNAHPAHVWALQLSMHLVLISLFETLFFWLFVSKSEDTALTSLVNSYAGGIIDSCANMTLVQRAALINYFNALVNVTTVNAAGAVAEAGRATYNGILTRNSWLYFGGLGGIFATLAAAAARRRVNWRHMITENLGMVTLLGLYEWMFFRTVVYEYRSISMPELDRMVSNEFVTQCRIIM